MPSLVPQTKQAARYCSFCGKESDEVEGLIAGPTANFICYECVELSMDIIWERRIARSMKDAF